MKEHSAELTLIALALIFAGLIIAFTVTNNSALVISSGKEYTQGVKTEIGTEAQTKTDASNKESNTELSLNFDDDSVQKDDSQEKSVGLPINLNSASANELCDNVPGIGEVLASRIIEYRETYGFYLSVDDLLIISGIGEATLEKIRPYVTV